MDELLLQNTPAAPRSADWRGDPEVPPAFLDASGLLDLQQFYADFAEQKLAKAECGSCNWCCHGPPVYMTCSDLEFALLQRAVPHRRVHFEPIDKARPDKRHAFRRWTCPLWSPTRGCTVYESRPFACRVFGPMRPETIEYDDCAYKSPRRYREAAEIPLWDRYLALLSRYPAQRGYVFPDSILHPRPAVELLMGHEMPDAPMQMIRLPFGMVP
ncbi:MAG: YkgJ family cysteine cluster protein [Candidatus Xenobia bacterium]